MFTQFTLLHGEIVLVSFFIDTQGFSLCLVPDPGSILECYSEHAEKKIRFVTAFNLKHMKENRSKNM